MHTQQHMLHLKYMYISCIIMYHHVKTATSTMEDHFGGAEKAMVLGT